MHEAPVAEHAVGVGELFAAAGGGFADGYLVFVHEVDDGEGVGRLFDLAEDFAAPGGDFEKVVGAVVGGGDVAQDGVEFAVAGVGDDDGAVGGGFGGGDEVGAGHGWGGEKEDQEEQEEETADEAGHLVVLSRGIGKS